MRIYRLENPVQRYAWGSSTGLTDCLGIPNPGGGPLAELWMGAHPKAPSIALVEGQRRRLDELIRENPKAFLGPEALSGFGPALPFLFKVLSAAIPLSIQAHPAKHKAEKGYERENLAGIPLDAADRNYRDRNHKPEMAIALTHFEGLYGFRPIDEIIENVRLVAASPERFESLVGRLERNPGRVELSVFFYSIIASDQIAKRSILENAERSVEALLAHGALSPEQEPSFRWAERLFKLFPGDIGALAPLILNHLVLEPGEAVFIGAGELHAHLSGTCLEIMANSDNVIRGALTGKYIDVPELISVLSFNAARWHPLRPERLGPEEERYPAPAPDFQIARLSVSRESRIEREVSGPQILLCTKGSVLLEESSGSLELERGSSAFVRADAGLYRISGEGELFLASLPPPRV
jgi:mannose-6-phosphate isomerase